ncbi:hypothetical protein FE810_09960 [Thalassotalea litorea]|uniref:7-cyano-7-deazaguanine synthase n=1 Tax=Thalassotalea litorea TaxID=2020715 RepID=A0A5R9IGW9_9GAMM|nr:hypothetical protein [Thalassotalea litorea]TLU64780.1 hypothetical protein FE810_09960 [Thalassotalea litorea]
MIISELSHEVNGEQHTISAYLDNFKLWFTLPTDIGRTDVIDAFVAAALLPAMHTGQPIIVQSKKPLSRTLLFGLTQLQRVYCQWWPHLSMVDIVAEQGTSDIYIKSNASFFSGGVDSIYSFVKNRKQLDALLFVEGIDIQLDNHRLLDEVKTKNQAFANTFNIPLINIRSNIRYLPHAFGLSWKKYFCGAGLAATGLLTGFQMVLIPSSQPIIDIYPDGTTPVTDPLYASEATRFFYDTPLVRYEKLAFLSKHRLAMQTLRVCWMDKGYNCGLCEKCLRTRLILRLLKSQCPTLQPLNDLKPILRWRLREIEDFKIVDNLLRAARHQKDKNVIRCLKYLIRRETFKNRLALFDKRLFNGYLKSGVYRMFGINSH